MFIFYEFRPFFIDNARVIYRKIRQYNNNNDESRDYGVIKEYLQDFLQGGAHYLYVK